MTFIEEINHFATQSSDDQITSFSYEASPDFDTLLYQTMEHVCNSLLNGEQVNMEE